MPLNHINKLLLFIGFTISLCSCKNEPNYVPITKVGSDHLIRISNSEFVGDQKCMECHQSEYDAWKGSHHDKAMQIADSTSILASFDGETFNSQGVQSKFFQKEGDFYVNTEGPDGSYQDYKIEYSFGFTPLQQYIVKFPDGNYQCLRTAWDSEQKKWFDLYPDFKVVHSEWLHWSRGGLKWNTMCADCHSTNVQKNYDVASNQYHTSYSQINVSCEACHGPGNSHIKSITNGGYEPSSSDLYMTSSTSPKELVDACARCHMRREQLGNTYTYQKDILDSYFPQLIETPIYHADGQILDEDYVYASFKQSKMYANNVSCKDCHNSHSLELKFQGNQLCLQCHEPNKYDVVSHHNHPENTESSLCINCHMPGKYYMGNDFRRDHSFRVPRPDLSVAYDTPNACTTCHKDKSNQWATEAFESLWGAVDSIHFSDKLIPGILAQAGGDLKLKELISDSNTPEIVRASAVNALRNYPIQEQLQNYIQLLNDSSAMVRATSIDVLNEFDEKQFAQQYISHLKDPVKSVRIRAFYGLGILTENEIPEEYKSAYADVKIEFDEYLKVNADFAGGRMREAGYLLKQGKVSEAITAYEKAVEIDGLNNYARSNLANLYYQTKAYDKAEAAFKIVEEQEPDFGQTFYSLGLLYAEQKKYNEAIEQLNQAFDLNPENQRIAYNLSLIYDATNQTKEAIAILKKALKIHKDNEELLYVLAFLHQKYQQISEAKAVAEHLVKLNPNNNQYQALLKSTFVTL